eukprot:45602-Pleurochrysis_carterae.AAC.3
MEQGAPCKLAAYNACDCSGEAAQTMSAKRLGHATVRCTPIDGKSTLHLVPSRESFNCTRIGADAHVEVSSLRFVG